MEDDRVGAQVELGANRVDALDGASGGCGGQPLFGQEGGDVLQLLRGGDLVDRS